MSIFDVAVVGAGPAGATAAYSARRAGFKVALLEKGYLHRPKVCGGLVTSPCLKVIKDTFGSGIAEEALLNPSVLGVHIIPPTGVKDGFTQANKRIYNVSREGFDGWLASRAIEAGVFPLEHFSFGHASVAGDLISLSASSRSETIRCRYLIGADGVYSSIRRWMRPEFPNMLANVVQDYFVDEGQFEANFYVLLKKAVSPSYAYVVPKDGYIMLGTGRVPGMPPEIDDGMSSLRKWLLQDFGFKGEEFVHREGWSVPFGSIFCGLGKTILVGDAGGFCHPFTAEGILYGVLAGSMVPNLLQRAMDGAGMFADLYAGTMTPVIELMSKFKGYVLGSSDGELERLAKEKREALVSAFGWDSNALSLRVPAHVASAH